VRSLFKKRPLFTKRLVSKINSQLRVSRPNRLFNLRRRIISAKKLTGKALRLFRNPLKLRRTALEIKHRALRSEHNFLESVGHRLTRPVKQGRRVKLKANFRTRASLFRRRSKKLSANLRSVEKNQVRIMFSQHRPHL
jgi:hypothetical protein